jgi:hypothetical protein
MGRTTDSAGRSQGSGQRPRAIAGGSGERTLLGEAGKDVLRGGVVRMTAAGVTVLPIGADLAAVTSERFVIG